MNLNPLYELKDRLESSIIAGVSLISEDFRLARAVEQMEPLSKASPVFGKIYQAAGHLLSDACTNKGDALLDLLGLVDAVLTTQAVNNVDGALEPIALTEGAVYSDAPYSQLAPVLEALTTSGSGHYSMIMEAHEAHPELFSDYRLKAALVTGLSAGYGELADQIEIWLCEEDATLLPLLKNGFDPKGKKDMVRRVHVIEAIAKETENPWYLSMLEEAEKDVRGALIYALRHSPENLDLLIGFTKTEKGNCKKAALWALARMDAEESHAFWTKQIEKKPAESAKYLALSTDDAASDMVADALNRMLAHLQAQADSGNLLMSAEDHETLQTLFLSTSGKASPKMLDWYRQAASTPLLDHMKDKDNKPLWFASHDDGKEQEAPSISHYIAKLLMESLLWSMDTRLFALAEELYQQHGDAFLAPALATALLTKEAGQVYAAFSPRLVKEGFLKKENEIQRQARLQIMSVFSKLSWNEKEQEYQLLGCYYDGFREQHTQIQRAVYEKPDIRWFECLTDPNLKTTGIFHIYQRDYYNKNSFYIRTSKDWSDVLTQMICPADAEICKILGHHFYLRLLSTLSAAHCRVYFPLLNRCGYQGGQGLIVKVAEKEKLHLTVIQTLIRISPMPLPDQLKELEELKRLVDNGKISVASWNEEMYQNFHTNLEKEMQAQCL